MRVEFLLYTPARVKKLLRWDGMGSIIKRKADYCKTHTGNNLMCKEIISFIPFRLSLYIIIGGQ